MTTATGAELDLLLIGAGYFIAIFTRFRIIIMVLHTIVFIVRIYQWLAKNRVDIDDHIVAYIHDIKRAEAMIFPVFLKPFMKKKRRKSDGVLAYEGDDI